MRTIIKTLVSLFVIISVVSSIMVFTASAAEVDLNLETWTESDCIDIKDFVEDNFSTFVEEYNNAHPGENFSATSIEFWSIINLVEDDNVGLYLDFNDDNGYFVGTGDYTIYEFQTSGDLTELRSQEEIWFSYADGFLHKEETGFVRLSSVVGDHAYDLHRNLNAVSNTVDLQHSDISYEGALGGGYIEHSSIEQYVDSAYPEYEYSDKAIYIRNFIGTPLNQDSTRYYAAYETDSTGTVWTNRVYDEGNCSLVAMYNTLKCWSFVAGASNIDYYTTVDIKSNITSDVHYSQYGSGALYHNPSYIENSSDNFGLENFEHYIWLFRSFQPFANMPLLYTQIRDHAITRGYLPHGGYGMDDIESTLEHILRLYGSTVDVSTTNLNVMTTDSFEQAKNSIDSGKAVVLGIENGTQNEKHAVCLIGYYEYKQTTGWWLWETTDYYYFFEIASGGLFNNLTYYDPYMYSSSLRFAYWG